MHWRALVAGMDSRGATLPVKLAARLNGVTAQRSAVHADAGLGNVSSALESTIAQSADNAVSSVSISELNTILLEVTPLEKKISKYTVLQLPCNFGCGPYHAEANDDVEVKDCERDG